MFQVMNTTMADAVTTPEGELIKGTVKDEVVGTAIYLLRKPAAWVGVDFFSGDESARILI